MYNKFIVEDDTLILGKVTYHNQLTLEPEKVKGGGWFTLDKVDGIYIFTFSGSSHQFGKANVKDILNAISNNPVYKDRLKVNKVKKAVFYYKDEIGDIIALYE